MPLGLIIPLGYFIMGILVSSIGLAVLNRLDDYNSFGRDFRKIDSEDRWWAVLIVVFWPLALVVLTVVGVLAGAIKLAVLPFRLAHFWTKPSAAIDPIKKRKRLVSSHLNGRPAQPKKQEELA